MDFQADPPLAKVARVVSARWILSREKKMMCKKKSRMKTLYKNATNRYYKELDILNLVQAIRPVKLYNQIMLNR